MKNLLTSLDEAVKLALLAQIAVNLLEPSEFLLSFSRLLTVLNLFRLFARRHCALHKIPKELVSFRSIKSSRVC